MYFFYIFIMYLSFSLFNPASGQGLIDLGHRQTGGHCHGSYQHPAIAEDRVSPLPLSNRLDAAAAIAG